ncbi:MAG: hypothetical protein F6K55_46020 [Moorea sp. SIO4A3]|nr:hypothetical protein [Moorena sp. SIO4A3]
MPMPRPDAHATARCPCHGQMPMPRPDAHATARCPCHGQMPIPQVRQLAN